MIKFLIVLGLFVVMGVIPAMLFSDNSILFADKLAEGLGRTIVTVALARLGLLYRRNTNVGFGVAAILSAALVLAGQLYLKSNSRAASSQDETGIRDVAVADVPETNAAASESEAVARQKLDPVNSERVPTLGEFSDKIDTAVEKFAEIYRKNGFAGAQRYSKACEDAALVSSDILETDFCVAFDLSAILVSFALQESTGIQRDPYFDGRVAGIVESQYTRYPQAQSDRKDIIWNEVRERLPRILELADQ